MYSRTGNLNDVVFFTGDDTPCALYKSTAIVAPRWPPRCTAALDAFLKVTRVGEALDYDGAVKQYRFL